MAIEQYALDLPAQFYHQLSRVKIEINVMIVALLPSSWQTSPDGEFSNSGIISTTAESSTTYTESEKALRQQIDKKQRWTYNSIRHTYTSEKFPSVTGSISKYRHGSICRVAKISNLAGVPHACSTNNLAIVIFMLRLHYSQMLSRSESAPLQRPSPEFNNTAPEC
ncbi:MAG: hypothetical protein AB4426_29525 [Xenococcaceae cyanobacterium]